MFEVFHKGLCIPNPGEIITYGAHILENQNTIYKISQKIIVSEKKSATNNCAEFCALIAALKYLLSKDIHRKGHNIYFYGDNFQTISAFERNKPNAGKKSYAYAVKFLELVSQFKCITFNKIHESRNLIAYNLAKSACKK